MSVGLSKSYAVGGDAVDVRGVKVFGSVTASVKSALVVCIKDDHIGFAVLDSGFKWFVVVR